MSCHWKKILIQKGIMCVFLLLQGVTGVCANTGNTLQLIKNSKAQCTIVLGKERSSSRAHSVKRSKITHGFPSNVLPEAAVDLVFYLNEIAQIYDKNHQAKIVDNVNLAKKKYRVLLGSVAIKEYNLEKEAQTLPYPAYIYRVIGNDLLIFGSSPKGTANGVYGFLQAELGVRWFGAQEIFHVVPKCDNITVQNLDKKVIPSFLGRRFLVETRKEHPAYHWGQRHMRMCEAVDNAEPFINSSHNLYLIYPRDVYAKQHAEYYPLRNGKRYIPNSQGWTPCLTNPEVVKIAIEKAKHAFKTDKRFHSFSLGINDTHIFCQCAECKKYNASSKSDSESNVYYRYVNQVAKAVGKEFPDRYIGCIAYNNVTLPPDFPLEKNVFVVIASDISEYYDQSYRKQSEEIIQAWEGKCKNLGLYYYGSLAKLVPAYFPRLVSKELKAKHKQGFNSLTCEVFPGWPWHGPMAYTTAQLWWDINQDIDDLLDEYFSKLYGPAADPMKRLYELFEQIHMRPRSGGFLYEHYNLAQLRPYTSNDLMKMRKYLAQAHNLAAETRGTYFPPKDDIAQRVAYVSNGLKVFLAMLEAYVKVKELEYPIETDNISMLSRLYQIDRVISILTEHDVLYRETIRGDEFQASRFTWDRCLPVREGWKNYVSSGISKATADLYNLNKKQKFDIRIRKCLERTLKTLNANSYCKILFMLNTMESDLGPNLVLNPSFEEALGTGKHPVGPNWVPADAPGWSLWPSENKSGFTMSSTESHSGNSLCISGISGGSYLTTINVTAGASYLASAYAKCLPQGETKNDVELIVRWFTNKNEWLSHNKVFYKKLHESNKWVKLETVVKVPSGATKAVIELKADIPFGEKVFFDDISFREIGVPELSLGIQLLANGSFEQVWGQGAYKECSPLQKGLPWGWSATPPGERTGIMDAVKTNSRTGSYAARMKGTGGKAYFFKSAPLSGSIGTYLCEMWVLNLSKSSNNNIYMEILWWGKEGWLFDKIIRTPLKEIEKGKWSKIELLAEAPEEAISHMSVFLISENLESDDEVMFDDVSIRKIIKKQ